MAQAEELLPTCVKSMVAQVQLDKRVPFTQPEFDLNGVSLPYVGHKLTYHAHIPTVLSKRRMVGVSMIMEINIL